MASIEEAVKAIRETVCDPYTTVCLLERLAQECHEAASDCAANWQEDAAGHPWEAIAAKLDKAIAGIVKDRRYAAVWGDLHKSRA